MGDLQDPRWMYLKGVLFLVIGALSSALLLWDHPDPRVALLLALAIWSFARAYYFAFYVIDHYIDPNERYAGLWAFVVRRWRARSGSGR